MTCRSCNDGKNAMHGQHLKANLYATRPFLFHPEPKKEATGVLVDLLTVMGSHLGFTFEGKWTENWWLFYENGTVEGSLGEVQ